MKLKSAARGRGSRVVGGLAVVVILGCSAVFPAWGQAPSTAPADAAGKVRDPLATKQQIVRDRMTQLEDRMFRLTEKLSKTEPDQAKRLEAAMRRAQEMLIRRGMDDAIDLLEEGNLTEAGERQVTVVKGLEGVLRILLEEADNTQERKAEIDRLRAYQQQLQKMLDEQRRLKTQADAAPRLAKLLAAIQAAITRLEALAEQQTRETADTSAAAQAGQPAAAGKLGETQKNIREETESVEKTLENPSAQPTERNSATPPAEGDSGRKPEGDQPAEVQPGSQGSSSPGSPGQPNAPPDPAQGRKETPAGQDPAKDEARVEAGVREARADLKQAGEQMKAAEGELGRQALPEALPMQKKAGESLRRAIEQLKRQEQETRRLLDQAEAARKQRELQKDAQKLAGQMKSGGQPGQQEKPSNGQQQPGGQQPGGQQGGQQENGQQPQGDQQQGQKGSQQQESGRPQEPAPGNQNVEKAGEHMQKSADDLEQNKPQDASPNQQKALDELEQARKQLQEALDQLRREQQEEILRGLESRFRAMLAQQVLINEGTLALDQKGKDAWAHADDLKLAALSQDQGGVADQAGQALNILKEEGTTVVFPRIVEQMREDMMQVASLLHDRKTGARTQRIENEIVTTLKEMIDSIKEMRKKLQDGESGGSGGQQQSQQAPPLLPSSAELKLLRSCQQRVARQTSDFHGEHPATPLDAEARAELEQIAERQQEVAEMARKMNERITGQ